MGDRHSALSAQGSFNPAVGQVAPPKKSRMKFWRAGTKSSAEDHELRAKLQKIGSEHGYPPTSIYQRGQGGTRSPSFDEGYPDGSELPLHGTSPHQHNNTSRLDPGRRSDLLKPDSPSQGNPNSESGDRQRRYEPRFGDSSAIMNPRVEVPGEPIQTAPNRGRRDSQYELAGTAVYQPAVDHRSKHQGGRDQSNNHAQKARHRDTGTAGPAEAPRGGGNAVPESWDARVSNGMSHPPNPTMASGSSRRGAFQNDTEYDPYRPRQVDAYPTAAYPHGTGTVEATVPERAPMLPPARSTSFGDMMANGRLPGLSPGGYAKPEPEDAADTRYVNVGETADRSREHPGSLLDARGQAAAERARARPHNDIDINGRTAELLRPYTGRPSPGAAWFRSLTELVERGQHVLEHEKHQDFANLEGLAFDLATAEASKKMYEEKYLQMMEFKDRHDRAQRTIADRDQQIDDLKARERSLERQVSNLKLEHKSELERERAKASADLECVQEQALQKENELKAQIEKLGVTHAAEIVRIQNEADARVRQNEEQAKLVTKQLNAEVSALTRRMASYSTNDYIAIPDEDLGLAFRGLSQKVTNISGRFPRPEECSSLGDLDPTDFLGRVLQQGSNRSWPKFLRHVCWVVLLRGFFHHPLGFGALGSGGRGHDEVLHVYRALERPLGNGLAGGGITFRMDQVSNHARASLFEGILRNVASDEQAEPIEYTAMYRQNVNSVAQEMVDVLTQVSNSQLDSRTIREVGSLVMDAGLLALKLGSQRAHVLLEACEHEQRVTLGPRFTSESAAGLSAALVDLMTQPCLLRVGDGHEDLVTENIIVIGDFVALKA